MILLSMVLELAIERVLSQLEGWREHALFERYVRWLHGVAGAGIWNSPLMLVVLLAPALLLTGLLQWLLAEAVYGVLGFVFSTLVLLLSLGPRDLGEEIRALLAARENGDAEGAERIRLDLLETPGRLTLTPQGQDRRSVVAARYPSSKSCVATSSRGCTRPPVTMPTTVLAQEFLISRRTLTACTSRCPTGRTWSQIW